MRCLAPARVGGLAVLEDQACGHLLFDLFIYLMLFNFLI